MADDRLEIAAGIDTAGLDADLRRSLTKLDGWAQSVSRLTPAQLRLDTSGIDADVARAIARVEVFQAAVAQTDLGSFPKAELFGALADELSQTAEGFRATSREAQVLGNLIRSLRAESELLRSVPPLPPLAAGGGGGGPPPPPPIDQFAAFRREVTATSGAVSELTATMAKGNVGNLNYALGMAKVEAQGKATNAELSESARRLAMYNEAGRQASLTPFAKGLEEIRLTGIGTRVELERGEPAFAKHAQGARTAANALSSLAAASIGAEGPVGRLAQTALLFSGGIGAVAAVAGAVLGLAKAVEFLTTKRREAQEKQDAYVQGLIQEADSAIPRAIRAHEALTAALEAQRKAREGFTAQEGSQLGGDIATIVTDPLTTVIAVRMELARRASEEEKKGITAVAQARQNLVNVEIDGLTKSMQAGLATNEQRDRAQELVKILTSQTHSLVVEEDERLRIAERLAPLEAAANANASARLAAQLQGIQAENSLRQQAISAQEADLRAQFAQEAITREASLSGELQARAEFYNKRRGLAVAAATADEDALRGQIRKIEERPAANTDKERADRSAQIAALETQLRLRQLLLEAQLKQITNEETLAKLTPLERVGNLPAPEQLLRGTDLKVRLKPEIDDSELRAALKQEIKDVQRFVDEVDFQHAFESARTLENVLHGVTMKLKDIGNANVTTPIDEFRTSWERTTEKMDQALSAARSIQQTLRGVGTDAGDAVGNVLDLGESLNNLGKDIASGNIFGAIADGISAIKSVGNLLGFGKSETEKLLEQAQRENTAALREATNAFRDQFKGAGGIGEQQKIVGQVVGGLTFESDGGIVGDDLAELRRAAEAAGISLDDLREIARANGISLVVDHNAVKGGATDLEKALRVAAEAATTFSDDLSARRTQLEVEDKLGIGGRSTDQSVSALEREREVQLGALKLDPATEARIRALDLSSIEGREAFLEFERDLFTRAKDGGLSVDELGGFQNVDDLVGSIGSAADGLDAFRDATDAATKQLQGVPDFFKLGEAEFAARATGIPGPGDGASLPPIVLPPLDLRNLPTGPRGTDLNPDLVTAMTPAAAQRPIVYITGDVIVRVDGSRDPASTARAVSDEFIRNVLAAGGNPDAVPR